MIAVIVGSVAASDFRGLATPTWCACPGNLSLAAIQPPAIADLFGTLLHEIKEAPLPNSAAADISRGLFYSLSIDSAANTPSLLVLSISNGTLLRRVALPFFKLPPAPFSFMGGGQAIEVDPIDGTVLLLGPDKDQPFGANATRTVYTLDPANDYKATFITHALSGDGHGIVDTAGGQESAYDYDAKTLYIGFDVEKTKGHLTPTLLAISLRDPREPVVRLEGEYGNMQGLVYDHRSKRVYGTGVGDKIRYLESFDSIKPDGVTRPEGGGTLNLYLSLNGVTAFDATQSLMYTLLCSRGPAACGEAYLVTVDLQKGTDTEQVRLCGDADAVEELVVEEDEDEPRRWEWEGGVMLARSGRAVGTRAGSPGDACPESIVAV